MEIKMEILLAVISGTAVFAISRFLEIVWLTPLQQYKEIKEEISRTLVDNERYYANPLLTGISTSIYEDVSDKTRAIAARLRGYIEVMPFVHPGIPKRQDLYEASKELIGLSNGLFGDFQAANQMRMKSVRNLLKIYGYNKESQLESDVK